jgi:hypothetical protein
MGFLSQWKMYLDQLSSRPGQNATTSAEDEDSVSARAEEFRGRKLDPTVFDKVMIAL